MERVRAQRRREIREIEETQRNTITLVDYWKETAVGTREILRKEESERDEAIFSRDARVFPDFFLVIRTKYDSLPKIHQNSTSAAKQSTNGCGFQIRYATDGLWVWVFSSSTKPEQLQMVPSGRVLSNLIHTLMRQSAVLKWFTGCVSAVVDDGEMHRMNNIVQASDPNNNHNLPSIHFYTYKT